MLFRGWRVKSLTVLALLLFASLASGDLLSSDIRLDTDTAGHRSSMLPVMAMDTRGNVHVAWQDYRDTNHAIYYRWSADLGRHWPAPETRISTWGAAEMPQICANNSGGVYVIWEAFSGKDTRICVNSSQDHGRTWLPQEVRLNTLRTSAIEPRIACDANGGVFAVWTEYYGFGDGVYFSRSLDSGATWSNPKRLNGDGVTKSLAGEPKIATDANGVLYLVYRDNASGSVNAFFRRSTDRGATWSNEVQLDPDDDADDTNGDGSGGVGNLEMAVSPGGVVHVIWSEGIQSAWANSSVDGGQTWRSHSVPVNDPPGFLAYIGLTVSPDGQTAYASYMIINAVRTDHALYVNATVDQGASWSKHQKLVQGDGYRYNIMDAQLAADNTAAYIIWPDPRHGYYDTFYSWTLDRGDTWADAVTPEHDTPGATRSWNVQIAALKQRVALLWDDRRNTDTTGKSDHDGAPEPYYNLHVAADVAASNATDTDGDGLGDADEVEVFGTLPDNEDTDGDMLSDGDELMVYLFDPTLYDTDGNGTRDGGVPIPDVRGLTQAVAEQLLQAYSMALGTVTEAYDPAVAVGLVISQDPAAGTNADRDTPVNLVISLGPAPPGEGEGEGEGEGGPLLGDVDGNGSVNAVDIQYVIRAVLNLSTPYDCDINGDGELTAVDIQMVINIQLGAAPAKRNPTLPAAIGFMALLLVPWRKCRSTLAVLLILGLAPMALAQPTTYKMVNDHIALEFQQNGNQVHLFQITSSESGIPITLHTGSGGWSFQIWDGVGNRNTDALTLKMDGTGFSSGPTLQAFGVSQYTATARWTGQVNYAGRTATFTITTSWVLTPTADAAEARIHVQMPDDPSLPFYVREVIFPYLYVEDIGTEDVLVAPLVTGYLLEDPITNGLPYILGAEVFPLSVMIYGYYDKATQNCFYFTDSDTEGWWRMLNVTANAAQNHLEFKARHTPENMFDTRDIQFPYAVRVGAMKGDWVDVAKRYNRFLHEEVPWYQGPVGSAANPMSQRMKNIIAHVQVGTNYDGDSLDTIERDIMRITRFYGEGLYTRWYGAHWPDRFEEFYRFGYLPGRPTFAAAAQESEKRYNHIVAPYIQGMNTYDPDTDVGQAPNDAYIYQSVAISEEGQRGQTFWDVGRPELAVSNAMCNEAPWWKIEFPRNAVEVCEFTGCHGLYLDYFGIPLCFSRDHDHLPGGGSYMMTARMQHVRDIKAGLQSIGIFDYGISMESVLGYMADEVELMFLDPMYNMSGTTYAKAVPFFRYVFDNVKMSKIVGVHTAASTPNHSAWLTAAEVFTFGQLIGIGSTVSEGGLTLANRAMMPSYLYERRVCSFLRDDGFLKWHNGTMERVPTIIITDADGFTTDPNPLPESSGGTYLAPYIEEVLVPGMWRAPDGSLAFAITNPWVEEGSRAFTFEATFDPTQYADMPSPYSVTRIDDDGTTTIESAQTTGSYLLTGTIQPGDIVYWVIQ